MVFVAEFVPSFCCVPDHPHRNFVFAGGHVAPFFLLKSSNFFFLLNFVVFQFFFCFFLVFSQFFLFSVFSVFDFLCFRFFVGTLSVLTALRFLSSGRGCFGVFFIF